MPDPEKLLNTLKRAAAAYSQTRDRKGHLVDLRWGIDLLVIGDLHGQVENFRRILTIADLGKHPGRHLVLQELVHGPFRYPDGGDKSHQLLDLAAALKCQFRDQVHFLLGNHELAQWTNHWIAKDEVDLNEHFQAGVTHAYGNCAQKVYAAYLELFGVIPVALRTPNRVLLSHSLPSAKWMDSFRLDQMHRERWEPADLERGGCVYSLVWGRDTSQANVDVFLRKMDSDWLITGHIPCDAGYVVPNANQIILDAKGSPAGYCLFPLDRPVTHQELIAGLNLLP